MAPDSIPVPVQGVSPQGLVDTWGAARSEGRKHRGIDIFAKRNTPVVSPVDGVVLSIGVNRLGGNVVRILGPGRQVHYLAHLEGYGPIREYSRVRRGEVVGFVGNSGNAKGTPTHLHYGIYVGTLGAINPYPLLTHDVSEGEPTHP
ncbi:MAG: M23 family metallopeptidase [Thermoanaerobaculia bacterium]|nr:M23 family metallopeptidase [Thermoanaerobaculia bacterium]